MATIEIIPANPFADGVAAGMDIGCTQVQARIDALLQSPYRCETLGAMTREALARMVTARMETPPDYGQYPELEDIYPERIEHLRGFAEGAACTLDDAALYSYLTYREEIDHWYHVYQLQPEPHHCSGVLLVGPDGVLGAHSVESGVPQPKPDTYRWRAPRPYAGLRSRKPTTPGLVVKKPRTGYIANWGVTNEKGVGIFAGTSCGVLLDEPIEDTWPIGPVPLLRFARDINHLAELFRRYTLFNWGRGSMVAADISGNGMIIEKSYRRVGIRMLNGAQAIWCTEGHFESPEMFAYIRAKRLEYLDKAGKHLGAGDMQYATDCAVRFTHMGELCHEPWGYGYEHLRRILTDHAPFPRAVCRHCGPDTDPYDETITQLSTFSDATHNRSITRAWVPWTKFCCQVPETVTQYPPLPGS